MPQIKVAPRDGLLVPFELHRRGQFIGVRHARPDDAPEAIVVPAGDGEKGGHSYVRNDPPYAVVDSASPYYQRRIRQGDLVEYEEPVAAEAAEADAAVEAAPEALEESTPDTAPRSRRSVR